MPTERDWGYLAGMIDGDGSISLTRQRGRDKHPTWFYYEPHLQIYGTSEEAIKGIGSDFGGNLSKHDNRGYGADHNKKMWKVYWQAQAKVAEVLRNVIPSLRIKQSQAELLLEYVEHRLSRPRHKAPLTPRDAEIHLLIKELNKQGGKTGHANRSNE